MVFIIEINEKKYCMGCHACLNICPNRCITMVSDSESFWYPKVDYDKCIKCGLCVKVCPIINKTVVNNEPSAYACINNDERIRLDSSSGGIFTLLAERILDKGGVVFGASFNNEFEVAHNYVEAKDELWKLRGSKYVQSKIGDSYKQAKEFLDQGKKVLFTGTPCQISGLKSYLQKKYDNLVSIDFICHGVPSPKVWQKYLSYRRSVDKAIPQRIAFRRKDEGWKRFSLLFSYENNKEYRQNLRKDLYMRAFLKDVCLRPSCYDCKFKGINRQSDITLADFWGIQNILPEMDDDKGTSLILINSEIGKVLFNEIKYLMTYQEVDIQESIKYNSAAIKSPSYNPKRDGFMIEKDVLSFDKLVNKYCSDPLSTRVIRKVKSGIKRVLIELR